MASVRCRHCMKTYRVYKQHPDGNGGFAVCKNEWWNFVDCEILGDGQEIGFDCGAKCCALWEKERKSASMAKEDE